MPSCDAAHNTPVRTRRRHVWLLAGAALSIAAACRSSAAQPEIADVAPVSADSGSMLLEPMLTRKDLQALAVHLDSVAKFGGDKDVRDRARADATLAQHRLQFGDFQPGDRFYLAISGGVVVTDTVTVLNGPSIDVKNVGVIPLTGVLRSELQTYLENQVLRYVKAATVNAEPLISVAMLGAIAKPGFYSFPAGLSLADAVMRAGGPITGTTDLDKTVIRRGNSVILDARGVQSALSRGISFDRLNLRSGDQIDFAQQKNISWLTVAQTAAGIISVIAVAYYGFRRR